MVSARQVARMASEVGFLCQGSHWSGQVPKPACARPNLGTLLPCQGTPASGAKQVVPVPWTWRSLTLQAVGAALLGPVQFVSGGQGFVSPSRIPRGLKQSWQIAWDLWKGLDGTQSLCLHSRPVGGKVGWCIGQL